MRSIKELRTTFLYGQLEKKFANLKKSSPKPISFKNVNKILIVAPHTDDEVIGCGGLIQFLKLSHNCSIDICFVTKEDGRSVSKPKLSEQGTDLRIDESKAAKNILQYDRAHYLMINERTLNDNKKAKLIFQEKIKYHILSINPEIILIPNHFDMNPDHRSVCKESLKLINSLTLAKQSIIKEILLYEIWGPVNATHYVELTEAMKKVKLEAMKCYQTQLQTVDYFGIMSKIELLRLVNNNREETSNFSNNTKSREYFELIRPEGLSKYINEHY
ncbi:PIG-L family deacetylase [Maribacter sp. M208]|uniref:PIG-L deacetylase family protein n=1 Tax=Maribacter huludaoensis TaxID=3030010 RepID=UPI0023ECE7CF|nr:PIG-L family deacetylase [Maribacter huludaoensis]MDF4221056.1 PIG-L family deacetylase [Maribacter huludaoensis]